MKIRRWISQLAASVLCVGMLAAGQTALGEALTKTITDFEEGQLLFDGSDQWNTEASAELSGRQAERQQVAEAAL